MAIIWETPPPQLPGRRAFWPDLLGELRERPGEWGIVSNSYSSSGVVSLIKRGHFGGTAKGEFDATSRKNADGTYRIYVRFVGAAS